MTPDIRDGTDFLGMKDGTTLAKWTERALQTLVFAVWQRSGTPMSENDVLRELRSRYPQGVPQGALDASLVRGVVRLLSKPRGGGPGEPIHQVSGTSWCGCSDGQHHGAISGPSPIVDRIESDIRAARFPVVP